MILTVALNAIIRFIPGAVANASPVIACHLLNGKFSTPIDFGIKLSKHRLFGKTKTWRGLFAGVLAGGLTGLLFGNPIFGAKLGLGAILGDLMGSFLKRRLNLESGSYGGLLDQIDFVVGALALTSSAWQPFEMAVLLLIASPIHRSMNFLAYKLKMKDVPW